MDNLTHTLVGVAMGRSSLLARSAAPEGSEPWLRARSAALWTAVIGNNLPDLDFLLQRNWGEGPARQLEYLLTHRGYTHTVLLAPLVGLLAGWLGMKLARAPRENFPALFLLGLLSAFAHVLADFCNEYGVHPFAPFWSHWVYGDFIFIVEPALWAALLPLAIFSARRRWSRIAWAAIAGIALGVLWLSSAVPAPVAVAVSLWGALVGAAQWKLKKARFAWLAAAVVLVVFWIGSRQARNEVHEAFSGARTGEILFQQVRSPAPGNPLCWRVIALSLTEDRKQYIGRVGYLSLAPSALPAPQCWRALRSESLGAKLPPSIPSERIAWSGEFRAPLAEGRRLAQERCMMASLLRFTRAPFWEREGETVTAGDLRYAFERTRFAFFRFLPRHEELCPKTLPPWETVGTLLLGPDSGVPGSGK